LDAVKEFNVTQKRMLKGLGGMGGGMGGMARAMKEIGRREPDPAPQQTEPAPGKRDSKLALTDLTSSPEGDSVYTIGRFRNTSGEDLKVGWATVHFEGADGKLIRTETGFCIPGTIPPGETGSFRVLQDADCRQASIKLNFTTDFGQTSISWTDESGKGAHP
jgi:hypothetical protein